MTPINLPIPLDNIIELAAGVTGTQSLAGTIGAFDDTPDDVRGPELTVEDWVPMDQDVFYLPPRLLNRAAYFVEKTWPTNFAARSTQWMEEFGANHLPYSLNSSEAGPSGLSDHKAVMRLLLNAALVQRRLVYGMAKLNCDTLKREWATIAACASKRAYNASAYFLYIRELAVAPPSAVSVAECWTSFLHSKRLVNHKLLLLDSIEGADTSCVETIGSNVFLVGQSESKRFAVLISELLDVRNPTSRDEAHEEQVRIGRSSLREMFWGRSPKSPEAAHVCAPPFYLNAGFVYKGTDVTCALDKDPSGVRDVEEIETSNGGRVISASRLAREFFGYKGLPTLRR